MMMQAIVQVSRSIRAPPSATMDTQPIQTGTYHSQGNDDDDDDDGLQKDIQTSTQHSQADYDDDDIKDVWGRWYAPSFVA